MDTKNHVTAIIVAGGRGNRMNSSTKKQFLRLSGKTVLALTIDAIASNEHIRELILVLPEGDFDFFFKKILPEVKTDMEIVVTPGGSRRQDSVYEGLKKVRNKQNMILIHDAVRPFVSQSILNQVIGDAVQSGAAISAVRVTDTVKRAGFGSTISETVPRSDLWMAQTPQVFCYSIILKAYKHAMAKGIDGTDDASLLEGIHEKVVLTEGSRLNIKITTPEDLILAEAIMNMF